MCLLSAFITFKFFTMSRILFTHSYFLQFDPKQWKTGQPYAPLAPLIAAAVLRQEGHEILFHDVMFESSAISIQPVLEKNKPDVLIIHDDGFNYLTKMCLTNMRHAAFEMVQLAKDAGCTVIVASSDATDHYELYLQKGADYIILGEVEVTIKELISALQNKSIQFNTIAGIAFEQQSSVIKTFRRENLRDLDSLPLPAWDLINFDPYKKMWLHSSGYFSINIATTRGCPFKCNWCAKPIYGNRYNSRSPEHVIKEIEMLQKKTGFTHIWFCDDIFGLKPGWIKRFADLVEEKKLQFTFKIQSRADLLVQENYVADLRRAGCNTVWLGAESGSQKILDTMDKGTTIEQIAEATSLLKKYNIRSGFFIQFGYPGETKKDIRKTIQMINSLLPAEIGISVSYPLPGTLFFENVKNQLQQKTNWTDSDELALMFRNTYQPAFYKQLHRYVHKSYRMHIALHSLKDILIKPFNTSFLKIKKAVSLIKYVPLTIIDKTKLLLLEE